MTVTVRRPFVATSSDSLSMDLRPRSDSAYILFLDGSEHVRTYIQPKPGPTHPTSIEVTQCINDNPDDSDFFPLTNNKIITKDTDMYLKPLTRLLRLQVPSNSHGGTISLHTSKSNMYYMHSSMSFSGKTEFTFPLDTSDTFELPIVSHASLFRWYVVQGNDTLGVRFGGGWKTVTFRIYRKSASTETIPLTLRGVPFIRSIGPIEYKLQIEPVSA